MVCKECGGKMYLDDKDISSKGNYDNYYLCENCIASCILEVRNGSPFKENWYVEYRGEPKEYSIMCQKNWEG